MSDVMDRLRKGKDNIMTNNTNKVKTMTTAALLCAIGILIPQIMPKIYIGPATYTLASHVAIFLAMFISPLIAIAVALITTMGFLLTGLPFVVVMRALSHVIFVMIGALILKKFPNTLQSPKTMVLFSIFISIIHALCEIFVVAYLTNSNVAFLVAFIGFGGFVHSIIDFSIAVVVWIPVQHFVNIPASAKIRVKARA
jgi:niacin transporter